MTNEKILARFKFELLTGTMEDMEQTIFGRTNFSDEPIIYAITVHSKKENLIARAILKDLGIQPNKYAIKRLEQNLRGVTNFTDCFLFSFDTNKFSSIYEHLFEPDSKILSDGTIHHLPSYCMQYQYSINDISSKE